MPAVVIACALAISAILVVAILSGTAGAALFATVCFAGLLATVAFRNPDK